MNMPKYLLIAAGLLAISSSAQAVLINFQALADGSLGESAWNSLMFRVNGTHTTSTSDAFLEITGTNGSNSYAYLDSNNAGLGVCGALHDASNSGQAFTNSRANHCNPSSDDNVTYHNGTPETLHFIFDAAVLIEGIWLNNNHDGDRSLLNDFVSIGVNGITSPTQLTDGGYMADSVLDPDLVLGAGDSFDVGFYPGSLCNNNGSYNDCEFYVSKIEFSAVRVPTTLVFNAVPEPEILVLLSLGLVGMVTVRHSQKRQGKSIAAS